MEPPNLGEKRASGRQKLSVPALVEFGNRESGPPSLLGGRTRDISNKGAYLYVPPLFRVGEHLQIDMELPPEDGRLWGLKIKFHAEVVRTEPGESGERNSGIAVRILRFEDPRIVPISSALPD